MDRLFITFNNFIMVNEHNSLLNSKDVHDLLCTIIKNFSIEKPKLSELRRLHITEQEYLDERFEIEAAEIQHALICFLNDLSKKTKKSGRSVLIVGEPGLYEVYPSPYSKDEILTDYKKRHSGKDIEIYCIPYADYFFIENVCLMSDIQEFKVL